jgi:hypothetical protein
MNIFEVKTRTNDASAFYIFNSNRKSKLEFILNETKILNINHWYFFSLLVITGFKDYQIKYTMVLKPNK